MNVGDDAWNIIFAEKEIENSFKYLANKVAVVPSDTFKTFFVNFIMNFVTFAVVDSNISLFGHQEVRTVYFLEFKTDGIQKVFGNDLSCFFA